MLSEKMVNGSIDLIVSDQLLAEIRLVCERPRLEKYFYKNDVLEMLSFLNLVGISYDVSPKNQVCRDPKDNFLLDLIEVSKAHFLVTGDKDLLALKNFLTAEIISPKDFEKRLMVKK